MDATTRFTCKDDAREYVWRVLTEQKAARFPFPVNGRIPNFAGAATAAERLLAHPLFDNVHCIKCNPDSPQRPVRELALRRGIVVLMPTPRLTGGFKRLDPAVIPPDAYAEAASLKHSDNWATDVALDELPAIDLVVTGSVAVTRSGKRCGKGHGYGDLEYAMLRELGHAPVAVVTSVHPLQIVGDFPADPHDLAVSVIATPDRIFEVADPPPPPAGLDWEALGEQALADMPLLAELRRLLGSRGR